MKKGPPKWEPTEEAFRTYLETDRKHALKNISRVLRENGFSHDTLHSRATLFPAMQAVLEEKAVQA